MDVQIKDYERDKDDQGLFLLLSTGQIKTCSGHSYVFICYFGQSATIKLMHVVFMVERWRVTVDFDSQYKNCTGRN